MKTNNRAFTLVELIVTITILAILATIAFLGLQGYSADARDSKRLNNLGSISNVIEFNIIKYSRIKPFLDIQTNTLSGHTYGGRLSLLGDNYYVGTLNYENLLIKEDDFLDPNGEKYIIGISTFYKALYQIGATLENKGTKIARIKGNFNARSSSGSLSNILAGAGTNKISLEVNNGIKHNDTIITNGTPNTTLKVNSVSNSNLGFKVVLDGVIPLDATYIKLKLDDSIGLIADKDDNTKAIYQSSTYLPY